MSWGANVWSLCCPLVSQLEFVLHMRRPHYMTLAVATPPEKDRTITTITGKKHRKPGEVWPCGSCDMCVDRQTDRLAYRNTPLPYLLKD